MRRMLLLAVALGMVVGAPMTAVAQNHDQPTNRGTTGLFTVPRANTVQDGRWTLGAYYDRIAREEGDTRIDTLSIVGAYGMSDNLEVYAGVSPIVDINRRFTAERDLLTAHRVLVSPGQYVQLPTCCTGINEHPFAVGNEHDGFGDVWAGMKYKFIGDSDEYNGVAFAADVTLPTSDTDAGIGTGDFSAGFKLIGSAAAGDTFGLNGYLGYVYHDTPDLASKLNSPLVRSVAGTTETILPTPFDFFVSPEVLYGVGVEYRLDSKVQLIGEWTGRVTTRDMTSSYTGGTDQSLIQGGLRLNTDSGWALSGAANYQTDIKVRDRPWQSNAEAVDDSIRRFGFLAGVSYSTSRYDPILYGGTAPRDVPLLNAGPTLTCRAERSTIRAGESVRVIATTSDPDGDSVTVTWNAAAGSLSATTGNEVTWNSSGVSAGSGNIVARADDGYGETADCTVRITVEAPPAPSEPRMLTFSCTDFNSGSSRIDNRCKAILDDVALQLRQNRGATAMITGHSDSAGAADRNNLMSQERADNARAYLMETHGVEAGRMTTASAGSSQPTGDNDTRAGRSQNRRIEIVVTIPPR